MGMRSLISSRHTTLIVEPTLFSHQRHKRAIILTHNMFRAFLMGYFLMQCEIPESRFYKALRIVVRNPGGRILSIKAIYSQ
jgi:hypothetical protein